MTPDRATGPDREIRGEAGGTKPPTYHSVRNEGESPLHHALREILLVESGRTIRHNMTDEEMWQAMTDIARAALAKVRGPRLLDDEGPYRDDN